MKNVLTVAPSSTEKEAVNSFIKENYYRLTNNELAIALSVKISIVRKISYELGLKRMELEYFTKIQIKYLIKNYQKIGDCEIAEIFQQKWPKQKGWTKKHIEKKRKYLSLHRTPAQIKLIHERNTQNGRFKICPVKAWNKRGRAPENEIRYWQNTAGRKYPVIKYNGRFVHWARWRWKQKYGTISPGMNVVFKDGNPYNRTMENLTLVSNKELARMNSKKSSQGLSDNYIAGLLTPHNKPLREILKKRPGLLELKRKQITLNRTIYEQQ